MLDLATGGLAADRAQRTHPTDHAPCQPLAATARKIRAVILRYTSLRDPAPGTSLAVPCCRAFAAPRPVE